MTIEIVVPPSVAEQFTAAKRTTAVVSPDEVVVPAWHPAQVVLARFGGLRVGACGTGEECASSDIDFGFEVDDQALNEVTEWQRLLSTVLVNIGEFHHRHGAFFMDAAGACYGMSLVHDAFWFIAPTFGEAVERLLLGRQSRPMLRPDQAFVTMFGQRMTPAHADVYWVGLPGRSA